MRTLILLSAVALGLAACSPGEDTTTEAPVEAAAVTPGRPAIYQAAAEGPEPFVRALYAVYVAGGPRDEPPAPGQDPIFSRRMNALIGADVRAARGEVPTLNHDPICGCQDLGVFTLDSVAVAQDDANSAEATVAFTNAGAAETRTLKLVREGPNWRVEDVIDGGESLAAQLLAVAEAAG